MEKELENDKPTSLQVVEFTAACFNHFFNSIAFPDLLPIIARIATKSGLPDPTGEVKTIGEGKPKATNGKEAKGEAKKEKKAGKITLYTLFMAKILAKLRAEQAEGKSLDMKQAFAHVSFLWKSLSDEEKKSFAEEYQPLLIRLNKQIVETNHSIENIPQYMADYEKNEISKSATKAAKTPVATPSKQNGTSKHHSGVSHPAVLHTEAAENQQDQEKRGEKKKKKKHRHTESELEEVPAAPVEVPLEPEVHNSDSKHERKKKKKKHDQ